MAKTSERCSAAPESALQVVQGEAARHGRAGRSHRLQAPDGPACRWNCKAGKCGSCSAEINGKPRLLCMSRLSDFDEAETITVTPLRTFPIIRDLVTDVSFNYVKARETPAFAPPPGVAPGDYRMQQVDVERSQEFRKCIECFLCQDVCHVIRDHDLKKRFAGPRFFIKAAALEMHPLDTADRTEYLKEHGGIGLCNITKCCTEVCPEHIHITDNAIIPLKERVADGYDPVVWVLRKLGLEPKSTRVTALMKITIQGKAPEGVRRAVPTGRSRDPRPARASAEAGGPGWGEGQRTRAGAQGGRREADADAGAPRARPETSA